MILNDELDDGILAAATASGVDWTVVNFETDMEKSYSTHAQQQWIREDLHWTTFRKGDLTLKCLLSLAVLRMESLLKSLPNLWYRHYISILLNHFPGVKS